MSDFDLRESDYFGFSATELCEDFEELVERTIQGSLLDLQTLLCDKFRTQRPKIEQQIETLTRLYLSKSKDALHKFKDQAHAILHLPNTIILPGYIEADQIVTSEQVDKVKAEFELLAREYLKERRYKAILEAELLKFQLLKPVYDKVESLKRTGCMDGEKSVAEMFDEVKQKSDSFLMNREKTDTSVFNIDIDDIFL